MLSDKIQAALTLINDYTDEYGRTTLNKAYLSKGGYDNENPNLFTGEGALLLRISKLLGNDELNYRVSCNIENAIRSVQRMKGLHGRHPRVSNQPYVHRGVSWDEHNGIMFMVAVNQRLRYVANEIIEYGEKYNWAFIDEAPGTNPYKEVWANKLQFLKSVLSLVQGGNINDHPLVRNFSRIRQPRDRGFYKIMSTKYTPSIIEVLSLAVASVLTSRTPYNITSGAIQAYFRFLAIESTEFYKRHKFKGALLKLAKRLYMRNITRTYGKTPLNAMISIYFKDKDHPFHVLSEGF